MSPAHCECVKMGTRTQRRVQGRQPCTGHLQPHVHALGITLMASTMTLISVRPGNWECACSAALLVSAASWSAVACSSLAPKPARIHSYDGTLVCEACKNQQQCEFETTGAVHNSSICVH